MAIDRLTRINELIKREIGQSLFHIIKAPDFDISAITITHVTTSRNLRNARVLVSIRDHQDQRTQMLSKIKQHRKDIQAIINKNLTLKYTPKLNFHLDTSLESGDHVLEILSKLEDETTMKDHNNTQTPPAMKDHENT